MEIRNKVWGAKRINSCRVHLHSSRVRICCVFKPLFEMKKEKKKRTPLSQQYRFIYTNMWAGFEKVQQPSFRTWEWHEWERERKSEDVGLAMDTNVGVGVNMNINANVDVGVNMNMNMNINVSVSV